MLNICVKNVCGQILNQNNFCPINGIAKTKYIIYNYEVYILFYNNISMCLTMNIWHQDT